jgi:hypothetical protein
MGKKKKKKTKTKEAAKKLAQGAKTVSQIGNWARNAFDWMNKEVD